MTGRTVTPLTTVVLLAASILRASVTVDPEVEYQTMDGMGALVSEWNMGIHNNQTLINTAVRDLGISIMRFLAIWQFEQTNENSDAESLDLARYSTGGDFATQMELIRKFQAAASGDLQVDKYFVSPLSPPAFMKDNNNVVGGKLRTDMYAEYAEYLAAYCKAVKQQTSTDLYAISMENEPEWEQWYASCVITASEMRDLIRVVGPRFAREQVPAKILWSETLTSSPNWGPYLAMTMLDTTARRYAGSGVYALHSYADGVNPTDPGSQTWTRVRNAVATYPGLGLWMSETSGYTNDWTGAITMARAIYSALKFGRVRAWVWHSINATDAGHYQEALMINGQPKVHYYIAKQFYRWIRPGSVMIEATTTDSIGVVAFRHRDNASLTVVLLNEKQYPQTVTLSGAGLPSFTAYRTSATENCVSAGAVSGSVTLPSSCVTTLYGTGYTPTVTVRQSVPARPATPTARLTGLYRLDGTRLAGGVHASAAGAVVMTSRDSPAARIGIAGGLR